MVLLKTDTNEGLHVEEKDWRSALSRVSVDQAANIRHAEIHGSAEWRIHVAEIAERVACHVHRKDDEVYEIVAGSGVLFYSMIEECPEGIKTGEVFRLPVKTGDVFVVPFNCAHQLVNTGAESLIILFACPDSHLGNDRFMLPEIVS